MILQPIKTHVSENTNMWPNIQKDTVYTKELVIVEKNCEATLQKKNNIYIYHSEGNALWNSRFGRISVISRIS